MPKHYALSSLTRFSKLSAWIDETIDLCKPDKVVLCDGSQAENSRICAEMTAKGCLIPLSQKLRPDSFWCHSTADDVARVEEATFICSQERIDAGPTNNWRDPQDMRRLLLGLFRGCMQGRTLYIVPFVMGPLKSPYARIGVQITDSPYVVVSMRIMTRMGDCALERLDDREFVPCLHSVGVPLLPGTHDVVWPCCAKNKYIVHFPEDLSIWSFGSGYGGNALLGKKSFALRIASLMACKEGWFAEHMLILGITDPHGIKKYFVAAFPSQCGKTNLAMLQSALPGWKIECVGDDIAWMHFNSDGQLHAINPEAGFFGVAPGTSRTSNPHAMETISHGTIFTNTALTPDGDVWWEGMTEKPPQRLTDWQGKSWTPSSGTTAAHPNARFTVPIKQCPIADPHWESSQGVPIEAILFGGRRAQTVPLVFGALDAQHGIFLGASISSETTSAAAGEVGKLRHDPFAMLPFCGYNMGDYFAHWLKLGKKNRLPPIYHVNWFRKKNGRWLWPGFGENIRVLKWIFENVSGKDNAVATPIGLVPKLDAIDTNGLNLSKDDLAELLSVDRKAWLAETAGLREYFTKFGSRFPSTLSEELERLEHRLTSEGGFPAV